MHSDFEKIRSNSRTLCIHKDFRNKSLESALLNGLENLRQNFNLEKVLSSKFARVYKFPVTFNSTPLNIYLKQYLYRSPWDFVKHLFIPSRAEKTFLAEKLLNRNNINTPTTIALLKKTIGPFATENFSISLEIPNAITIHQSVPPNTPLSKEQLRQKRDLLSSFAKTVGLMHKANISHGDLRLGNILVESRESHWLFYLLDNERTKQFRRLPLRLRIKNLTQLNLYPPKNITNTDRIRFFNQYWLLQQLPQSAKKPLIKAVIKNTGRRLRKKHIF